MLAFKMDGGVWWRLVVIVCPFLEQLVGLSGAEDLGVIFAVALRKLARYGAARWERTSRQMDDHGGECEKFERASNYFYHSCNGCRLGWGLDLVQCSIADAGETPTLLSSICRQQLVRSEGDSTWVVVVGSREDPAWFFVEQLVSCEAEFW